MAATKESSKDTANGLFRAASPKGAAASAEEADAAGSSLKTPTGGRKVRGRDRNESEGLASSGSSKAKMAAKEEEEEVEEDTPVRRETRAMRSSQTDEPQEEAKPEATAKSGSAPEGLSIKSPKSSASRGGGEGARTPSTRQSPRHTVQTTPQANAAGGASEVEESEAGPPSARRRRAGLPGKDSKDQSAAPAQSPSSTPRSSRAKSRGEGNDVDGDREPEGEAAQRVPRASPRGKAAAAPADDKAEKASNRGDSATEEDGGADTADLDDEAFARALQREFMGLRGTRESRHGGGGDAAAQPDTPLDGTAKRDREGEVPTPRGSKRMAQAITA